MTTNDLIAKQQMRIEKMRRTIRRHNQAKEKIHGLIFCIGGPLNDNCDQYTPKQAQIFFEIDRILKS